MIIRDHQVNENSTLVEVTKKIELSVMNFFLTGSRFFGDSTPESDWDYFVNAGSNVERELRSWGFSRISSFAVVGVEGTVYKDSFCISVWEHPEANIHIQIVNDAIMKNRVQLFIKNHAPTFMKYKEMKKKSREREHSSWIRGVWDEVRGIIQTLDTINFGSR